MYADWNKIAYRQYDHEHVEEVESVKVTLTPETRKPAQPTSVKENPKVLQIIKSSSRVKRSKF